MGTDRYHCKQPASDSANPYPGPHISSLSSKFFTSPTSAGIVCFVRQNGHNSGIPYLAAIPSTNPMNCFGGIALKFSLPRPHFANLPLQRGGRGAKRRGWGSRPRSRHDPSPNCLRQFDPPFSREGCLSLNISSIVRFYGRLGGGAQICLQAEFVRGFACLANIRR